MSELLQVLALIAVPTALLLTFRYLTVRADREFKDAKRHRYNRRAPAIEPEEPAS